jgi:uncharacterized repeat protein (TIGR02543 family)
LKRGTPVKKILLTLGLIASSLFLFACQNEVATLEDVYNDLKIIYTEENSEENVTHNLILKTRSDLNKDARITWESSHPDLIDSYGNVIQPDDQVVVTLTATITLDGRSMTRDFTLTLIGKYTYYHVTIHLGDDVSTLRLKEGTILEVPEHIIVEGYQFMGWFTNQAKTIPFDFDTPLSEHLNLYAKYEEIVIGSYTVSIYHQNLEDDGYTLISTQQGTRAFGPFTTSYPSWDGFEVNLEDSIISGMISLEPLNLVIRYDRKQYQVKYISDDVILYDELHKFGKILNPLNAPVKEGYEFVDWSLSPTIQIDYNFNQPLESHVILYARWAFIDGVSYEGYYEGADGLSGSSLRTFLYQRVNQGFNRVSYATATTALQVSDRDPNNSSNIILVYLGTSVNGTWDSGVTWNREHVWPQSLLGVGTSIGPGTDLHNLKPANPSENSSRGNKYYDVATTSSTYLPRAAVRGDLARILFYMDIAYTNLTLVNSAPNTYQMAKLDVLLRWHLEDPVDDFERNRNDVIYTYQSNRNPFIDHPEFVEKIWGPITLSNQETIQIKFYETFDVIEITVYITDLSVFKKEQDWLM